MPRVSRSFFVCVVSIFCFFATLCDAQETRRQKKLIETGWDMPDSRRLAAMLGDVERWPFDGVVVQAIGDKDDGSAISLSWGFVKEPWRRAWFQSSVDQLKSCKFKRYTDNFVMFNANPGNVDWFDDAGWKNIVEHWRIAAWVARQSGFKGLCFDPEPYVNPHAQFQYSAQAEREKHSFADYCEKARQRGREIMTAVAEEYPNITIFSFFLDSVTGQAADNSDPRSVLAGEGYGLLPAMVDGWLDAAPAAVTIVDGHESAYLYNNRLAYLEAGNRIRNACQNLVSPANRAKYRAQVQVGFGVYLDAYWNNEKSPWHIRATDGTRVDRLRANVHDALAVADEYVWIYGEQFRWWPTPNRSVKPSLWPEALPGCDRALGFARNPIAFAQQELVKLRAGAKNANLARNGRFDSDKAASLDGSPVIYKEGGCPAGWSCWQREKSNGVFSWDRQTGATGKSLGAAKIAGVADGCFIQTYRVKPGEFYAVSALLRTQGVGQGNIRIRWQTAEGKWTCEPLDVFSEPTPGVAASQAEPWRPIIAAMEVPAGVGRMVVLLGAAGQQRSTDVLWYDDVEVFKLP